MRNFQPLIALAFWPLGLACIPGNSPVRVTGTFPLDDKCAVNDKLSQTQGTLDLSGPGIYLLDLRLNSELVAPTQMSTTGMELMTAGEDNFIVDTEANAYTVKDSMTGASVGTLEAEDLPTFFVVQPGATGVDLFGDIIGPKALAKLPNLVPDTTTRVILTLTITLKGHLESGTPMQSNPISYPINVFNSGQTCTNGFVAAGACSTTNPPGTPGQDGAPVMCL